MGAFLNMTAATRHQQLRLALGNIAPGALLAIIAARSR
jgi:hypothetical protein